MDPRLLDRTSKSSGNWKINAKKETESFLKETKNTNEGFERKSIKSKLPTLKKKEDVEIALENAPNSKGYFSNVPAFIWYILGAGALIYVAKKQKLF